MPRLPVEKIRKLRGRDLSVNGRNKLAKESLSCDPSVVSDYTHRVSKAATERVGATSTQEMYKSQYDGAHRPMIAELEYE